MSVWSIRHIISVTCYKFEDLASTMCAELIKQNYHPQRVSKATTLWCIMVHTMDQDMHLMQKSPLVNHCTSLRKYDIFLPVQIHHYIHSIDEWECSPWPSLLRRQAPYESTETPYSLNFVIAWSLKLWPPQLEMNAAARTFWVLFFGGAIISYSAQEKYPTGTSDARLVVITTVKPFLDIVIILSVLCAQKPLR